MDDFLYAVLIAANRSGQTHPYTDMFNQKHQLQLRLWFSFVLNLAPKVNVFAGWWVWGGGYKDDIWSLHCKYV